MKGDLIMGYTTYFNGSFKFNKPVEDWLTEYIHKFSTTRRMKRDNEKIKELFPNWESMCFNGYLGKDGEYFVGGTGFYGQDKDESVINYNGPACTQPGLWCDWEIDATNNELVWNEAEKFYYYIDWLEYLIDNFFEPLGYVLNGEVKWEGEESEDLGIIHVENNVIDVSYGVHAYSLSSVDTGDLIAELRSRGYKVTA